MHVHRPEFGSKDKEFVMQKGKRPGATWRQRDKVLTCMRDDWETHCGRLSLPKSVSIVVGHVGPLLRLPHVPDSAVPRGGWLG